MVKRDSNVCIQNGPGAGYFMLGYSNPVRKYERAAGSPCILDTSSESLGKAQFSQRFQLWEVIIAQQGLDIKSIVGSRQLRWLIVALNYQCELRSQDSLFHFLHSLWIAFPYSGERK